MNHEIIDNFLPKEKFKSIQDVIMSNKFNWFYHPDVAYPYQKDNGTLFYFTHLFYDMDIPLSPFFDFLNENLISKIDIKSLIRVKANLYPNQNVKKTNGFHSDYNYPHKGAIFYINTNNGKTLLDEKIKIDSVENRLLLFNSHKPHDSENCTDEKVRVNININYF